MRRTHILVADPSLIVRSGVEAVLNSIEDISIDIAQLDDLSSLSKVVDKLSPDILIINPAQLGINTPQDLLPTAKNIRFIALQSSFTNEQQLKSFDAVINIFDTADLIARKLEKILSPEEVVSEQVELSQREKEIIAAIAKGMSNKEIADDLCISAHTVMTHRRNVTNKLQIHSPAGLTIYAIVNKIIDISEVQSY